MRKVDNLLSRLGANISESTGSRSPAAPVSVPGSGALSAESEKYKGAVRPRNTLALPLDQIIPDPNQPRKEFDPEALAELAESLKTRGQLQPCRIRWSAEASKWVIVVGERRYRAAIMAGLPTLLCVESSTPQTPEEILEDQLVENCVREDLSAPDQAAAFRKLMDLRGWSYRQLGAALNLSAGQISRVIDLLDLPESVQDQVRSGELAATTASELSKAGDPEIQVQLAQQAVAEGWSRSEAREKVQEATKRPRGKGASSAKPKGKPKRLPAELKRRDGNGVKVVATTTARHAYSDVIAALRAFADELESAIKAEDDQRAA
jgi:ParB family chromosome partitioning protein